MRSIIWIKQSNHSTIIERFWFFGHNLFLILLMFANKGGSQNHVNNRITRNSACYCCCVVSISRSEHPTFADFVTYTVINCCLLPVCSNVTTLDGTLSTEHSKLITVCLIFELLAKIASYIQGKVSNKIWVNIHNSGILCEVGYVCWYGFPSAFSYLFFKKIES